MILVMIWDGCAASMNDSSSVRGPIFKAYLPAIMNQHIKIITIGHLQNFTVPFHYLWKNI
jgi:hypothetical protein